MRDFHGSAGPIETDFNRQARALAALPCGERAGTPRVVLPRGFALTIAGSDPSGGAGLQADLKTFHQHGVYGMAVVSLLTVQSTQGVSRVETIEPDLLQQQIEHLLADIVPGAAKTGALGNAALVKAIARCAKRFTFPLVVDPVMISKHGHALLDDEAVKTLQSELLPQTFLLTPNVHEAMRLTGLHVETVDDAERAAVQLREFGVRNVLVKGGHLRGDAVDVLIEENGARHRFSGPRLPSSNTHGTGCTYSAAIVANLSQGSSLSESVSAAKAWLTDALRSAVPVGKGIGPVNHFSPVPSGK